MTILLDREEYVEQAYFFRILRERLAEGLATQEILDRLDQEILSTTRLPYAIHFLATELKHSGHLASGFVRLGHYFTAFQAFIIRGAEEETKRFSLDVALLVLQREAEYRAGPDQIGPAGLFVYQFEVLCRSRLGYDEGLTSLASDPLYDGNWRAYLEMLRSQIGLVDLADLIYLRSTLYVQDQRRNDPDYEPPVPPLFGEKEGKIARAHRDRDPLLLFAALQRHLGYPEVPRPKPRDQVGDIVPVLQQRLRDLEQRLKLLEAEVKGDIQLEEFGKPERWDED